MAHLATFFLTVNYGLNAFLRLQEKVQNLQFSSVSVGNETQSNGKSSFCGLSYATETKSFRQI